MDPLQIFGSIGASRFVNWLEPRLKNRYLTTLLNFTQGELLFVLPHREHEPTAIMPRVALEDVLAMRNIMHILSKTTWKGSVGFRDVSHLSDSDKKKNIFTIGGPEANIFTREILNCLPESERLIFEHDPSCLTQWIIRRGEITTYRSSSYAVPDGAAVEIERSDVGLLVKTKNPYKDGAIVLVVAGIRGIGTWGAADCLRKSAKEIYRRKRKNEVLRKDGDFSMVIAAKYKNFDIQATEVRDFVDLA